MADPAYSEYEDDEENVQQSSSTRGSLPPNLTQPRARDSLYQDTQRRWKDIWTRVPLSGQSSSTHFGADILSTLRSERGGIVYAKRNAFHQVYFVDNNPIFRCDLIPRGLIPVAETNFTHTDLGLSLVLREALDLLGYAYVQDLPGQISVSGDLDLVGLLAQESKFRQIDILNRLKLKK